MLTTKIKLNPIATSELYLFLSNLMDCLVDPTYFANKWDLAIISINYIFASSFSTKFKITQMAT